MPGTTDEPAADHCPLPHPLQADDSRAIVVAVPHSQGLVPHVVMLFTFFDELKHRIP